MAKRTWQTDRVRLMIDRAASELGGALNEYWANNENYASEEYALVEKACPVSNAHALLDLLAIWTQNLKEGKEFDRKQITLPVFEEDYEEA